MIERLAGRCLLKQGGSLILDVSGVGYGVEMSDLALSRVVEGQEVVVWVYTQVKEDLLKLFGFTTHGERQLFELLLKVNDVGPKLAMSILGTLTLRQLLDAVQAEDVAPLEAVKGVGEKKSKLILLTLKNRLEKLQALDLAEGASGLRPERAPGAASGAERGLPAGTLADLRSALENFGYKDRELQALLRRFERAPPTLDLAGLIRLALAELTSAPKESRQALLASDEELF